MDLYELARAANLSLSVALIMACNMRLTRDWPQWSRRERAVRVHVTAYLFVIAYGTVEAWASGAEPGPRILLTLLVHISFALAMFRNRNDPA